MRRRRAAVLTAAVAVAAAGCGAPLDADDHVGGDSTGAVRRPGGELAAHGAGVADPGLCSVLPARIVGELIGAGPALEATGRGAHCTWRPTLAARRNAQNPAPPATDGPTMQGALLDRPAYDAGRPVPGDPSVLAVADVDGVGDEAFVVHLAHGAPTTLYARDGTRVVSLWLDGTTLAPAAVERSLARTAALLLRLV